MTVKPEIKSFLIADMVIQEKAGNKWSAIGIFDKIFAPHFPCVHHSLGLYIRLADAEGNYDIRVEFCDMSGRTLAVFSGIKLSIPSRLINADFGISTMNLPIPQPGKYEFKLYFNNEFIQSFALEIYQLEVKQA